MEETKFTSSYLCCILALYALRSGAQLTPWLATSARAIVYLAIYVFPAIWVLKGQRRQLHQPTAAPEGQAAGECEAIASVDCNTTCTSFKFGTKNEGVVVPDTEQQLCTDCSPVALSSNQQKSPLLPPEVSLRDWKGRSTTSGGSRCSKDGAGCTYLADGTCYASSPLCPCCLDLGMGLSQSGVRPSTLDRHVHVSDSELDFKTSDVCQSMPAPSSGEESALAGLSSARSYDLTARTSDTRAVVAHSSGSSPLELHSSTNMDLQAAAVPAAPLFNAGGTSCCLGNAVGHDSCSTAVFSRHLLDNPIPAATHVQEAVPAATATPAVGGADLAGVGSSRSNAAPGAVAPSLDCIARSHPTLPSFSASTCSSGTCVSISKHPSAEAAARHPPISEQQAGTGLSCPAALCAAAAADPTGQGGGTVMSAAAHGAYAAETLQNASAQLSTRALVWQAAADYSASDLSGHVTAASPLPMPPNLTIRTLRRTLSAQHLPQQQRDEQPGTAESATKSEGSVDQPSTPVFLASSSRFLRHTASAASGCLGSRSSSSGMQNPLPLPSPANSPLARRVTNERDEHGFPLTPGLVELLQQREHRLSSGLCDADNQQGLQQSAPWAGLQLKSVSQRLSLEGCSSCRTGSVGSCLSCGTSTDDSSTASMASSSCSSSVTSAASGSSRFHTGPN